MALTVAVLASACALAGCSQTSTHAQAHTSETAPVTFIGQWGTKGNDPGQLDEPTCIATDTLGNVYMADVGSHYIDKFGPTGVPHLSFEDPALKAPESIAVDSGGAIYVADASRGTVSIYLPSGQRLRTLRRRLEVNKENRLDVAVDVEGLIYLFDSEARRVFTYTPRFRLVRVWQPSANVPNAQVRASAMTGSPDGSLYFVDPEKNRILHFSADGHFLSAIDAGAGGSERRLSDQIAVFGGYVFVMDTDGRTLHAWTIAGAPKGDVDLAPELGQGSRPAPPLAASPRKELLVLDAPEGRVLRYRINF
jgi:DNA-binding beta-propeller fold protein YncE